VPELIADAHQRAAEEVLSGVAARAVAASPHGVVGGVLGEDAIVGAEQQLAERGNGELRSDDGEHHVRAPVVPAGRERDLTSRALGLERAGREADLFVLDRCAGFCGLEGVLAGGELHEPRAVVPGRDCKRRAREV
jgi:hypothetical protein